MEQRHEIVLSAEAVGKPANLPPYCVRHGRAVAQRRDFALQSRAQPQGSRFMSANALGVAGRLGEKARKVQTVGVRDWPLCGRCARTRKILFGLTQIMFWSALVLIPGMLIARFVIGHPNGVLGAFLGIGFLLLFSSPFVFYSASLTRLVQARASDDGTSVIINHPHQNFVDAVSASDSEPKNL